MAQAQTPVSLNAAVLPSSRATAVGSTVTVFASVINGGDTDASDCFVAIPPAGNPSGITFSYRAFQADNATPAAAPDTPVNIAGHASQSFVLALTPANTFAGTDISFTFGCASGPDAPVIKAVNTLFMTASNVATPDIITIGATPTNDGVVHIGTLGGAEVMTVAAVNIGAGAGSAPIIVAADTGDTPLPLDIFVCETDPSTSVCKNPPSTTTNTVIGPSPSTFAVFANSTKGAGVPNFPDMARLHMRYYDGSAAADNPQKGSGSPAFLPPSGATGIFGATSTGVTSPGPDSTAADAFPVGIYTIRSLENSGGAEKGGFVIVNERGEITSGLYSANVDNFPDPDKYIVGSFSNVSAANGSAQRTLDTSYSYITEDNAGNQTLHTGFIGSGLWNPKSNVLISFSPPAGSGLNAGSYKLVYTGEFDRPVTLASLAGTYDGVDRDTNTGNFSQFGTLTIAADGTMSGNVTPDPGETCAVSGALAAFAGGGNLFDINMTLSGGTCSIAGSMVGNVFSADVEDKNRGVLVKNALKMIIRTGNNSFVSFARFVPTGSIPLP